MNSLNLITEVAPTTAYLTPGLLEAGDKNDYDLQMEDLLGQNNQYLEIAPYVISVESRSFTKFKKGVTNTFSLDIDSALRKTADTLVTRVKDAKFAWVGMDRIQILVIPKTASPDTLMKDSVLHAGGEISAITSECVSLASTSFCRNYTHPDGKDLFFRAKVFNLKKDEVQKYFNWVQVRNRFSFIRHVAAIHFGGAWVKDQNSESMSQRLLSERGLVLEEAFPQTALNGSCILTQPLNTNELSLGGTLNREIRSFRTVDTEVPLFNDERDYIGRYTL